MFREIPLKTGFYNFSQEVFLDDNTYTLRFNYLPRQDSYILDILNSSGEVLEGGIPCVVDIQLNRRFVHILSGSLFFQSPDPKISSVDRLSLGTSVKLFYYQADA